MKGLGISLIRGEEAVFAKSAASRCIAGDAIAAACFAHFCSIIPVEGRIAGHTVCIILAGSTIGRATTANISFDIIFGNAVRALNLRLISRYGALSAVLIAFRAG